MNGVGVSNGGVFARVVPKQFRTPDHVVRGNLIFKKLANGALRLVGQLEQVGETERVNLAGLCGGDKRLQLLNAAGSVASILNLGVCVIGFAHVSKLLHRIEDRIERIETKLVEVAELAGVIDQKVDQLVELSEGQTKALAALHELMVSFETARVHAALETLDFLSRTSQSGQRDERLIGCAETLQVFRNWLAEKRAATEEAAAGRVELLRAEVAVVLAECRARCLAEDVHFAGRVLERVLENAQVEVARMYEWLMAHGGIRHLVMASYQTTEAGTASFDTADAVEAVAWVEGVSATDAAVHLLTELRDSHEQLQWEVQHLGLEVQSRDAAGMMLLVQHQTKGLPDPTQEELEHFLATGTILGGTSDEMDENNELGLKLPELFGEEVGSEQADEGATAQPFHAAGFVAAYRLMRDVETAGAMCKAMEVFGEPVRELLFEDALPGSPALALTWEPEVPDST